MKNVILLMCAVMALLATGCSDDDQGVKLSTVEMTVSLPDEYSSLSADSVSVTLKNVSTGHVYSGKTDSDGKVGLTVEEGVYNISASVEKASLSEMGAMLAFQAAQSGISISGVTVKRNLSLEFAALSKEWLIREIYLTGSKTPGNKNYLNDQYVVIYNNSDETLYADGLSFCETYQMTTGLETVNWSQFLPSRVAAGAVYTVPGTGKEHPVAPGKGIVLASLGVNHTLGEYNPNSKADMSKADFEWFDGDKDVDVPEVPNLDKKFCYSATTLILNSQGAKSYFIFKLPEDMELDAFLAENAVSVPNASGSKNLPSYAIPVKYIYDGVEFAKDGNLGAHALPSAVDAGYTYTSGIGSGKVVRRKVASWAGERAILQDTNNSSSDFELAQEPSPYTVAK